MLMEKYSSYDTFLKNVIGKHGDNLSHVWKIKMFRVNVFLFANFLSCD